MAYCSNCGAKLNNGDKFCSSCGKSVIDSISNDNSTRKEEYIGKVLKCPYCCEILESFTTTCPSCGYELRNVKPSDAVKEFSLKIEKIESNRKYEKTHGFFSNLNRISRTDEQKISLIKSFSVPNSKEDMLEFMILAYSNINLNIYDGTKVYSASQKALNDAWLSKVGQVYEKAKLSYSNDRLFEKINQYYNKCNADIRKYKRKGILKYVLMIGPQIFWIPNKFDLAKAGSFLRWKNVLLDLFLFRIFSIFDKKRV